MPANTALSGQHVLVTRPAEQAGYLMQKLSELGAEVLHQPAIAIKPVSSSQHQSVINQLDQYDIAIFISSNAVDYGLQLVSHTTTWPAKLKIACIGKATARACKRQHLPVDYLPEQGFDSEALLALPAFSQSQIRGKNIIIFRGGEGREYIKEVLTKRDAVVQYLDVYQRERANLILKPADFAILDTILISSTQGLQNLLDMLGPVSTKLLFTKRIVVPGQRSAEAAQSLGFTHILIADDASDDAMLASLLKSDAATIE